MADVFTKEKRSEVMSKIRGTGNKDTEIAFIHILRREKISGWRRHWKLFGKPDFVFPKSRLAVFIDGCFWHRCPKHCKIPEANCDFWKKKLSANKSRDCMVRKKLRSQGWNVLRIWEHELKMPIGVIKKLTKLLQ